MPVYYQIGPEKTHAAAYIGLFKKPGRYITYWMLISLTDT